MEGETLPRFDLKSRMFGNVKYPGEHRIPEYAQKAAFLPRDRLKVVSFHILLLDRAGNNLVNSDFSPYFRMFFAVKHIYLTLYIAYMRRIAPI